MNENCIEFFIKKFSYIDNVENADIGFISPLVKRRMSKLDKCALSVLNECYCPDVEYIVFSSKTGEFERLTKIISQYTEENEVSPNLFSGSVHNYLAGLFLLIKQHSIPYTALSADNESFSSGFLSSLISKYNNILFCYADFTDNNAFAFCANISKSAMKDCIKYKIKIVNNKNITSTANDFYNLFTGKINFLETHLYKIERANND